MITFNSFLRLLFVISTCFSLFAIDEMRSSSAFVLCLGGNFGVGTTSFDLPFLSTDREEEGGGGIYDWKSRYILSATKVSNASGAISFSAALTNELLSLEVGLVEEGGRLCCLADYLDLDLSFQLFWILKSPFKKIFIETKYYSSYILNSITILIMIIIIYDDKIMNIIFITIA